jgi:Fe-S cluster assembly ATP-binding protein
MLEINNLEITVNHHPVLQGINLTIKAGEIHAIMGPNGSGKSSLAYALAGKDSYSITDGSVQFDHQDLKIMAPEQRALAGLFLGFQYPVEIPGVSNIYLLRSGYNALRKARNEPELDAMDFLNLVRKQLDLLEIDQDFLYRSVNEGFSGGEKKRNELLQMAILKPKLAVLDEIDSGLDIDALQVVAKALNRLHSKESAILLITHYQRLLNYVKPDFVHVLAQGKIIKSGDFSLAQKLEKQGYGWLIE